MRTSSVARWIKQSNMELQFWGYEIGNVLAAIAGVGGFLTFYDDLVSVSQISRQAEQPSYLDLLVQIASQYPDILVIVGIGLIALFAPVTRKFIAKSKSLALLNLWDVLCIMVALALVAFAIKTNTSWITVSGATFVVASSFLRFSHDNPVFLKLGAIFLQLGGIALSLFGVGSLHESPTLIDGVLGVLLCLTGYYVFAAGTLTYEGGIFITREMTQKMASANVPSNALSERLLNPASGLLPGLLKKMLDKLNLNISCLLVKPSLFWISESTKKDKPFLTSMKARLPWRLLTAMVALMIGTQAGFALAAANLFWAIGDVALGSLDWVGAAENKAENSVAQTKRQAEFEIVKFNSHNHQRMLTKVRRKYARFSARQYR